MITSSGPFSLAPGQETTIDFAYVFTWDSTAPNGLTTSIARNIADLQRIKYWFDTDSFPSCLLLNVGVDELEEGNFDFNIFPNPAHDKLCIQFSAQHKADPERFFEVIDLFGRKISSGNLKRNYIDISKLNDGMYFLRLKQKDKVHSRKFIKD